VKSYVINLDRHVERWERFSALFAQHGIAVERVPAVDATHFGQAYFDEWLSPRPKYVLSNAEIACTLSHRAVWERFLAGNDEFCVVFEDDIEFGDSLRRFTEDGSWIPADADIVKLETFAYRTFVKTSGFEAFGRDVKRLGAAHYGTAAYIIRRRAAEKLLRLTKTIDRTTDDIMFDVRAIHLHRLLSYQVDPAVCAQYSRLHENDAGFLGSSIVPKRRLVRKNPFGRFAAELVRPFRKLLVSIFIRAPLRLAGFRKITVDYIA